MRHPERFEPRPMGSRCASLAAFSLLSLAVTATSSLAASHGTAVDGVALDRGGRVQQSIGLQAGKARQRDVATETRSSSVEASARDAVAIARTQKTNVRGAAALARPPIKIAFDQGRLSMLEPGMKLALPLAAEASPSSYFVTDHGVLEDGTVWKRLAGMDDPRAEGTIVIRDGAVAGWLLGVEENRLVEWRLKPSIKGTATVIRRGDDRIADARGGVAGFGEDVPDADGPPTSQARRGLDTDCEDCASELLDVAFFYTSELVDSLAAEIAAEQGLEVGDARPIAVSNIRSEIALQVVNANNALENSALESRVVRVAEREILWAEAGSNLLSTFSSGSGAIGSEVALWRDVYGADACVLLSATTGSVVEPQNPFGEALSWDGTPDSAFSYMVYGEAGGATYAYLLGRTLGLGPVAGDIDVDPQTCEVIPPGFDLCCTPLASGTPANAWRFVTPTFGFSCIRTIMADATGGGIQVLYYSNPEVSYFGIPTGSPETAQDGRWANNASVFADNFAVATAFRCAVPLQGPTTPPGSSGQQLLPGGLTSFDGFGTAVTSSGEYLFVSAPGQGTASPESGAVFQFTNFGTPEAPVWERARRLAPAEAGADAGFGVSIAADREFLVVGSPRTDLTDEFGDLLVPDVGAVFIYRNQNYCELGLAGTCVGDFDGNGVVDGGDFGTLLVEWGACTGPCVADLNGDGVVDGGDVGAFLVLWGECGDVEPCPLPDYCLMDIIQPELGLGASEAGEFGLSVDIASNVLAVGQPGYDDVDAGSSAGRVWLFSWQPETETFELLVDDDPAEEDRKIGVFAGQRFGTAVAISNPDAGQVFQTVTVGSPEAGSITAPDLSVGQADVFLVFSDGAGTYVTGFLESMASPWPDQAGRYGTALTAFGPYVAVGAPDARISGRVVLYRIDLDEFGSATLFQVREFDGDFGGVPQDADFGAALDAFQGLPYEGEKIDAIVVGSPLWDKMLGASSALTDIGTALVFGRAAWADDTEWNYIDRVDDGLATAGDRLGSSVSLVGASITVGVPLENQFGFLAGAAFVQEVEYNDCNENGIEDSLEIYTGQASDTNNDGFPDECILGDCDADIDGNGTVDGMDLGELFVQWGACPDCPDPSEPSCPELCPADLNLDGVVDGSDLGDLFLSWGITDCPVAP